MIKCYLPSSLFDRNTVVTLTRERERERSREVLRILRYTDSVENSVERA